MNDNFIDLKLDNIKTPTIEEIYQYEENNSHVGSFGIPYLDERLEGIFKNDLVLIGARSGAGKTTLAHMIARANENVTLFSLENFKNDDFYTQFYYEFKKLGNNERYQTLAQFLKNRKLNGEKARTAKAYNAAKKKMENIRIIPRDGNYTLEKLKHDMVEAVAKYGSKIIILDHLDYLDKSDIKENDNLHVSKMMRLIRDFQSAFDCGIVCFSHLRKSDSKLGSAVPGMHEFMGSSSKVKESTVVITLAPDDEDNRKNIYSDEKSTFCCIRKARRVGIDNSVARMMFNVSTGSYEKEKTMCSVNFDGTKVIELEQEADHGNGERNRY